MKKHSPLLVGFCLVSTLLSMHAAAQKEITADSLSLKDLLNVKVVTASKLSQGLEMAPATVIVVTKEQIRQRNYQSLLDVMYDLPDIKVDDKIYSGILNSFTVRGIQGSEKFIILIDGVSISSPSGEAMPIMENYPVNLAEQIEIVYGAASALYGANAVSGVINIITKKSKSKLDLNLSSTAGTYGYTNNTLFLSKQIGSGTRLVVSGQYAYDRGVDYSRLYHDDPQLNIDSYASGTINSIYGPMMPEKKISPKYEAPMQAWNIYAALHSNHFDFSIFRNAFNVPTAFGNNTSNAVYNKEVTMLQNITTASASYKRVFEKISNTTALICSQYNLDPQSNYRNLYTDMEPAYKYSTNTMVRAEDQLDYKVSEELNLSAGLSYENYNAIPQSGDLQAPIDKNDYLHAAYLGTPTYYRPEGLPAQFYYIKYHNLGSYLQLQYSPIENLHFTLGARYDYNSRYGSTFNPRVGFVYNAGSSTTIKLLYGRSFLAPMPSDAYAQWGSFETTDSGKTYSSSFLHLPNPSLSPIRSDNMEMSVNRNLGDNFFVAVDAYYTLLKGLHEFSDDNATTKLYNGMFNGIPVSYVEVFTNNNRQKNWGGSLQLKWKNTINKFSFTSYALLSYVNGLVEKGLNEKIESEPDKELDFISPFIYHFGIDGKFGRFSISPRLIVLSKQHISGISDSTGSVYKRQALKGYALLNLALSYNASGSCSMFVNISNALDQRYRSVGFNMDLKNSNTELFYGQPEDPIRIAAGIRFSF